MAPARGAPHLGSVLSDADVDIEDIAAGHINSGVTRNVNRYQIADKVTKAPAAVDAIFGQVSGS